MKIKDLSVRPVPILMKWSLRGTPHVTIEPNMTCNMRCHYCYNLNQTHIKSLEAVKREIEIAASKRNLQAITLVGGEPTLHPQIAEIVTYIKSKSKFCQIATNGLIFNDDKRDTLLKTLITSGLDRILLHIDSGQKQFHIDLEVFRKKLFSKLERNRINYSLSLTIGNEDRCSIPALIRKYSHNKYFDGIIGFLAKDPNRPRIRIAELVDEYRQMRQELNIEPAAYVPSSLDDSDICWLLYIFLIDSANGETFAISPVVIGYLQRFYRLLKDCNLFVYKIKARHLFLAAPFLLLFEVIANLRRFLPSIKFLYALATRRSVRFHYVVLQQPPEFNEEKQKIQMCYHCPDATIRNGLLTSVCVADLINPYDNKPEIQVIRDDIRRVVYEHLGEL
jgi:pyruvate-formate lyase-activating enzyme